MKNTFWLFANIARNCYYSSPRAGVDIARDKTATLTGSRSRGGPIPNLGPAPVARAGFRSLADLNGRLPAETFHREELPFDAAFLAGRAFAAYRRRGGPRTSPIADFYIGAHAAVAGYRLLTRDSAMVRTYFPHLSLIAPK